EDLQVVNDPAAVPVHADGGQLLAVLGGRGHPDLVAPDDWRRPALAVDRRLPAHVLGLRPAQRRGRRGVAVGGQAAEGGPVVERHRGGGGGRKGEGEQQRSG